MLRFNPAYFILAFLLVATDILIVDSLHDAVIRPYGGGRPLEKKKDAIDPGNH